MLCGFSTLLKKTHESEHHAIRYNILTLLHAKNVFNHFNKNFNNTVIGLTVFPLQKRKGGSLDVILAEIKSKITS